MCKVVFLAAVDADRHDLHALVFIVALQIDQPLLVLLGDRAMVAGEHDDDRLGVLVLVEAVQFVVGAETAGQEGAVSPMLRTLLNRPAAAALASTATPTKAIARILRIAICS